MDFYSILVNLHSIFRWLILFTIIITIVTYLIRWQKKSNFQSGDKKWALMTLIFAHLQLVIGLILYFISPEVVFNEETMGDTRLRFYAVEHISVMLIAIILITLGYRQLKAQIADPSKYKRVFWYYLIALILMLSRIPWPFQDLGADWF
jgi:low temperature requirement protein LtrA